MAELYLHGRRVASVFQLLGTEEDDISRSVGWGLARSSSLLRITLQEAIGWSGPTGSVVVRLQQHESQGGITDIELQCEDDFHIIIEAKRGWCLPGRQQLEKYAARRSFRESKAVIKRIIAVSECSRVYAAHHLGVHNLAGGCAVGFMSWKDIYQYALRARRVGTHAENRLLDELITYLRSLMTMQKADSNWVFVVSLGSDTPSGWGVSWIDIVNKHHHYFHPVGGSRWPAEPPNYIAFRYRGRLQSIHHVEAYEVFTNPHSHSDEIPDQDWGPHFLYDLGPAFAPAHEVRTGGIYPSGHVWCMLDTLFTAETVAQARDDSKRRAEAAGI